MSEKPLHVKVAEALGCKPRQLETQRPIWGCTCQPTWGPFYPHAGPQGTVAILNYDSDWSAAGPLIEAKKIMLMPNEVVGIWEAMDSNGIQFAEGPTPLVAVCNLLLLLSEDPPRF